MSLNNYFLAFVPIFVAVDALGMLPVFIGLTDGMQRGEKQVLVRNSTIIALFVAVAFLFVGKLVFAWLGITINDFMVAGGAILFIVSIRDLLSFHRGPRLTGETIGVVPLAVPLIVGPAVLTTSLILWDSLGPGPTLISVISNIVICGIVLRFSDRLSAVLGQVGSHTLSKISNLLLAAIGVMLMRRGVFEMLLQWPLR
jgi:multiple antibiotic resistance protein